jgi:hypothetical protein
MYYTAPRPFPFCAEAEQCQFNNDFRVISTFSDAELGIRLNAPNVYLFENSWLEKSGETSLKSIEKGDAHKLVIKMRVLMTEALRAIYEQQPALISAQIESLTAIKKDLEVVHSKRKYSFNFLYTHSL